MPSNVHAMLAARVAALDEAARAMIEVAAVVGDEPTAVVLAEVSAVAPSQVLAVLDAAMEAGIVREKEAEIYEFTHPLFRASVYERLTTSSRVALHARVGQALERLRGRGVTVDAAALAHHFGRSAPLGNARAAVGYAVEAGD